MEQLPPALHDGLGKQQEAVDPMDEDDCTPNPARGRARHLQRVAGKLHSKRNGGQLCHARRSDGREWPGLLILSNPTPEFIGRREIARALWGATLQGFQCSSLLEFEFALLFNK